MPILLLILQSFSVLSSILLLAIQLLLISNQLSLSLLIFSLILELIVLLNSLYVSRFGSKLYKVRSSVYLFLYSLFGAVFLLSGIILLLLITGTTNLMFMFLFSFNAEISIALLFTVGFGVKVPIFPLHYWLPEVHTESTTAGSCLLAGILLKLGIYGLIRLVVRLLIGTAFWSPLIFLLSLYGCLIASINCLSNYDIKTIIAYSSISHQNFSIAALFTFSIFGLMGCVITSVAHGLSSSCGFVVLLLLVLFMIELNHETHWVWRA